MEMTKEHTSIIKGMAICLMLWHHLFLQNESYDAFIQWTGLVGKICVALFLYVSGYGLVKTYENRVQNHVLTLKDKIIKSVLFLVHRLWKFYISYWPMMICVIIVGVLCGYGLSDAYAGLNPWKRLGIELLGMNGWYSYLGPWWFNKLIIQLWILFFLFYLLLCNKWISVLGGIALLLCEQFDLIPLFCFQEGGVLTFYLGMMMAKYDWPKYTKWEIALPVGIIFIGGLLAVWHFIPCIKFSIAHAFVAWIICQLISLCRGGRMSIFRYIGIHSTNMYLCHALFILLCPNIIYYFHFPMIDFAILFILSLGSSLVLEMILNRFFPYHTRI